MPKALLEVTHDAIELPRRERLALARMLLDLDQAEPAGADVEAAWEEEIRARVAAYDAGQLLTVPYEEVRARMERRFQK